MTWGLTCARLGALAALLLAAIPTVAPAEAVAPPVGVDNPAAPAPAAIEIVRAEPARAAAPGPRPQARREAVPHARWAHRGEAYLWTRAALSALGDHGAPLVRMVPGDIQTWCPAYPQASPDQRAAFWVGFLSALTKHESTYRPEAVGGGGLWYGLLQILPSTARLYDCRARSGAALKNGAANLSCAIRIMAKTVPRDGVIHAYSSQYKRKWRGVSADWGPMRSSAKRADMAGWLRAQSYCKPLSSLRPRPRPKGLVPG
ncbi:transglycosylase SLT domain-containing protein [Marimonas lutisalis]|uniref:transglycosylase SLT domain-containing protein n=1 Tax=Marimonas lutisalis TaxID=2545756 RepID=UPI0010F7358A|nr:transglycosylase SLT domain-containing protein [Marimonas lutisalis]